MAQDHHRKAILSLGDFHMVSNTCISKVRNVSNKSTLRKELSYMPMVIIHVPEIRCPTKLLLHFSNLSGRSRYCQA